MLYKIKDDYYKVTLINTSNDYKQIILNRGLPFEVKLPTAKPVNVAELSEIELDAELEKGYADMQTGQTKNAKKALTRSCESGIILVPLRAGFFVVQR